ncbi:uncharacterized protein SPAPADRAFT_55906 [Spathaspora passalidarum NRRL Y-27907]|uniref:Protein YIP n=1 Tax=Spathaspora passalidarum (strain NRRL Y-27907 / 11-Y1) TaxID=619300 RepID=G3AN46_SPAPN|nr:uncharacterized protein SPAPADRAFT_55906 [Spathaspora passalidarum NRRL Y-27907]EGW32460.1 hypothetical protein SPAPADRAFT_55906 [Spathaspora passalidarum NRRL Y-27907]
MFQINFYRPYFDLDSDMFFYKIQRALNPFATSFGEPNEEENSNQPAELYGFFWITGTLIFLMFVSSTGSNLLAQWLYGDASKKKYEYSFDLLTKSISLFYGYNIIAPGLLYLITTFFYKFPYGLSLSKVISIYGYTNVLWFPITIVNVLIVVLINNQNHHLMLNLFEWIIVVISGIVTGLSNLAKLTPIIKKNSLIIHEGDSSGANRLYYTIVGALAVAHLLFTVLVKISFFGIKV